MTVVKLSERQRYALLALHEAAELDPADQRGCGGEWLSHLMTGAGRGTSTAGAHQAANGLVLKNLAVKGLDSSTGRMRYKLTDTGRALAAQIREQVSDGG